MPNLTAHHALTYIKAINVGMSGAGKTGALASLALAGYNLHILDYDNGLDILVDLLRDDPDAMRRVQYVTLRDRLATRRGSVVVVPPTTAFKRAGNTLDRWGAGSFTAKDIIVLETLTSFSEAGLNEARSLSGRLNERPQLQDWGWMAEALRRFIEMLTDPGDEEATPPRPPTFPCHLIVNTHIRYMDSDEERPARDAQRSAKTQVDAIDILRGVPNCLGQEVPRTVGRYFNTVLLTTTQGKGRAMKRLITTIPQGIIEVKCSAPKRAKAVYPQETGLADLFHDILNTTPSKET